ncbi:MAG: PASTA domain-containing protein [Acidimicrobiales bacterium]|nr:PASTA domain-containing protein [Acidimicrobiales bacterium]HRW36952.1 PASTA domain-containing protein [Aquihabitans sp.]
MDPHDDDLAERLRDGFGSLARAAGSPSPLPDRPEAPVPASRPAVARPLVVAAALVAVVAIAVVAVATRRDEPRQQLRAGEPTTTGAAWTVPEPADTGRLVCPPALVDLSGLDATPAVVPPGEAADGTAVSAYVLRWEQDGHQVELSYPEPFWGDVTLGISVPEDVALGDGRVAAIERSDPLTARVLRPGEEGQVIPLCSMFQLSIDAPHDDEDARATLLDAARAIQVHAPTGTVVVPDVVGLGQVEAQDVLARAGLVRDGSFAFSDEPSIFGPLPSVASQDPAAGSTVAIGTEVHLGLPATTTTTTQPPPVVEVDALPIPTDPLVCPISRLQVDDEFRSLPVVHAQTTISWFQDGDLGGYQVLLSWPKRSYRQPDEHGTRELTVLGRPALVHDGGDGQDLVYDTGLPGACRYLEIGVYGGPSIPERERRAEALAPKVTVAPPPTADPPAVVGLSVADAADRLARAGFLPDWGADRAVGDAPAPPSTTQRVTAQALTEPGVVRLAT